MQHCEAPSVENDVHSSLLVQLVMLKGVALSALVMYLEEVRVVVTSSLVCFVELVSASSSEGQQTFTEF